MFKLDAYNRERLACAYFFAAPGLAYGIFTARLPAIRNLVHANDGQIGLLLLAFGASSFVGLVCCHPLMARFGAKKIIGLTGLLLPFLMSAAVVTHSYIYLVSVCLFCGLVSGLCEVAMNAQGMMIEQRYARHCMSSLHACFSLGGMSGSLAGSLFAALNIGPALNFLLVSGFYALLLPLAYRRMANGSVSATRRKDKVSKRGLPMFIYLLGLVSMLCYVSEGSVGEWGSILLHTEKGAPQDIAALVFGCFCVAMVIFRLLGDRLRDVLGDVFLACAGGLLGAFCMCVVLLSDSPILCLFAYTCMGAGFAPIVPILFSRAGSVPGIEAARASSAMSILSYTGLLVFPPFLGMLGDAIGLNNALWIITFSCLVIGVTSPFLLRKDNQRGRVAGDE